MLCPDELGGASYFEPVTTELSELPTHEHFPLSKREGGKVAVDNVILGPPQQRRTGRLDANLVAPSLAGLPGRSRFRANGERGPATPDARACLDAAAAQIRTRVRAPYEHFVIVPSARCSLSRCTPLCRRD